MDHFPVQSLVYFIRHRSAVFLQANNPFVVRFYYSFSSPEKLFLVMEYCPGGDLSSLLQHLGRFDEDTARQYIAETVLALEYCHSKVRLLVNSWLYPVLC